MLSTLVGYRVSLVVLASATVLGCGVRTAAATAKQAPHQLDRRIDPTAITANEEIVRRWVEVWNEQNLDAVDDLLAPDFVRHDPNSPEVRGPAAERQFIELYLTAFPDLHFTIEELVSNGDTVAVRLTAVGTQRGELLGLPPTGKTVRIAVMEMYRIADGRIAEQWVVMDALGLLKQLGALPAS
jgi:steroid delta-isomerase-like uncharacterized protein